MSSVKRMSPPESTGRQFALSSSSSSGSEGSRELPVIRKVAPDSTEPRCKGKVVIATGCNSPTGIGRASAHQFAANGARAVFICDIDGTHLGALEAEMRAAYPRVAVNVRRFDATDEAAVSAIVDEALALYKRLDVFFANAGTNGSHLPMSQSSGADFMHTVRTNALSVFLACKHGARGMRHVAPDSDADGAANAGKTAPGGSIVATASVAGLRANAGASDYSASKAAVVSLVQTCAFQLARSGVRCNAICPGLVETGMTSLAFERARARGTEDKIGQLNPTGRAAVADEVARVCLFLASDESSYINGQAIAVCGGLSAGHPWVPGKLA